MKMYKFKMGNIEIELPEPTQETFEEFWKSSHLSLFLGGLKEQIKKDLQTLIDTETYEIIEEKNGKRK